MDCLKFSFYMTGQTGISVKTMVMRGSTENALGCTGRCLCANNAGHGPAVQLVVNKQTPDGI